MNEITKKKKIDNRTAIDVYIDKFWKTNKLSQKKINDFQLDDQILIGN